MNEDQYRWAMILLFGAVLPVAAYHRIQSFRGGPVSRKGEGRLIFWGLRFSALAALLMLTTYLFRPEAMRWSQVSLPEWLRWCGVPIGIASWAWLTWMFRSLGHNLTDTVAVRSNAQLVTHGPYRLVRHPFYLGLAALLVAVVLLSADWLILVLASAVLGFLVARTRIEEEKLVDHFGDAYRDYRARTGKFWPGVRKG